MPWTIGIVVQEDLERGRLVPSYLLYRLFGEKNLEFRMRDVAPRIRKNHVSPLYTFERPYGHDALIEYLSTQRTHDESDFYGFILGALFYFEVDEKERMTGKSILIKHIPDESLTAQINVKRSLYEAKKATEVESFSDRFSTEVNAVTLEECKPQYAQKDPWYHKEKGTHK